MTASHPTSSANPNLDHRQNLSNVSPSPRGEGRGEGVPRLVYTVVPPLKTDDEFTPELARIRPGTRLVFHRLFSALLEFFVVKINFLYRTTNPS